jgi:hypothetical protein
VPNISTLPVPQTDSEYRQSKMAPVRYRTYRFLSLSLFDRLHRLNV